MSARKIVSFGRELHRAQKEVADSYARAAYADALRHKAPSTEILADALEVAADNLAREARPAKRAPLLIDEFLAQKPLPSDIMSPRREEAIRSRLREAKVYKFDGAAARYCGEMMRAHPAVIARDQDFAIPPFPTTYVEYDVSPLFHALGQN